MKYRYCRERDGIVHLDITLSGKRIRRSTGRPATAANMKYVEKNWQAELERLTSNKPSDVQPDITVETYGYKSLEVNRAYREESTNIDYKQAFVKHIIPFFGQIPLNVIVQSDIKQWHTALKDKGLSPKRISSISIILQGIMKDAVSDNLISRSPFFNLKGVSRKALKEITPFTLEEVKYILSNSEGWFKNFLAVAFFTGMRTGELLALRWEDVNLHSSNIIVRHSMSRGKIKCTKTGKTRIIEMLPPVVTALKEQFKYTGLKGESVFYSRWTQDAFTNTSTIGRHHWKPLLKRLLIADRALYHTRHTFATMMITKGEDITWVSKMLGHSNPSITLSVYTRYVENKSVKRAQFLDEIDVFSVAKSERFCHVSVTREKSEQILTVA